MTPETEDILRQSSFLQFLPKDHFDRVGPLFREVRYDFGDLIVKQGDEADAFFVLTSGRARVVKRGDSGDELVLGSLMPGSEFGESALLRRETRTATVRCSTAVEALRLSRDNFLKVVEAFPKLRNYLETTARWRTLHRFLYE